METIARLKISLVLLMLTTACKGLGVFPEQADASSPNSTLEDFTITDTLGEETTWIMRGASALLKG
ncbi:MAG: hypothetical protein GX817_05900 [Elusimicrobia bacterium]|nr:hypothetical protein [Elusimicrobiota bacterium]